MYPVLFSVFSFSINMSVSCVLTASFPLSRSSLISVIFILYRVCNILVKIRRERGGYKLFKDYFPIGFFFGVECLYVSFIKGVRFFAYPHSFVYFYTRVYEQSTKVVFLVHISERKRLTTVNGSAHGLGCDITLVLQQTAYVLRTCSVQCFIV